MTSCVGSMRQICNVIGFKSFQELRKLQSKYTRYSMNAKRKRMKARNCLWNLVFKGLVYPNYSLNWTRHASQVTGLGPWHLARSQNIRQVILIVTEPKLVWAEKLFNDIKVCPFKECSGENLLDLLIKSVLTRPGDIQQSDHHYRDH